MNQLVHSNDNQLATDTKSVETPPESLKPIAPEMGGREGPEPTRYGDWEKKRPLYRFLTNG
jgi:hypothetical protein